MHVFSLISSTHSLHQIDLYAWLSSNHHQHPSFASGPYSNENLCSFPLDSLCTSPSHEVLLIKQWTDFSDEESWEIYEVRDLSLDLLHSGSYNASEVVNHQTNYTICLKLNQVYKFIMKDAYLS